MSIDNTNILCQETLQVQAKKQVRKVRKYPLVTNNSSLLKVKVKNLLQV